MGDFDSSRRADRSRVFISKYNFLQENCIFTKDTNPNHYFLLTAAFIKGKEKKMASYRSRLLEEMSDNSILGISSLSIRDDNAENGGAAALIASMRSTMTSEFHSSYRESAELMQVCGASTTPRRSNRLRSTASRPANPTSTENILQGIRTDLNLPLQNRNQNLNSNGRMNLTGPDMHLVMGPSVMESGYIPTIQNYPQIDVNDLFAKKEEALNRVSKLESDLSEKDGKIRDLQNW